MHFPLRVQICDACLLMQLGQFQPVEEIFADTYPYFSSFSTSWVEHARRYVEEMVARLDLNAGSLVAEVAANDGYLLQHVQAAGIPAYGIEPTANTARAARERGLSMDNVFLTQDSAPDIVARRGLADLVVANNVYAHVPDLVDFTKALALLLAPQGTLTIEVQHAARMIELGQFDTVYHEHFQYYTLLTLQRALASGDLVVTDVEELPTHGGSLRVFARHLAAVEQAGIRPSERVDQVLAAERTAGLHEVSGYLGFASAASQVKRDLLEFLLHAQAEGATVAGYGAPGKGNTMLNYCGVRSDLLAFTVDRNPHKHGLFLPGSRIPVREPEALAQAQPDYVLVLPWNLRDEISQQLAYVAQWGGRLVFAVPSLQIVEPGEAA